MNKKSHSGVFMMEMISVVFFFILCASICIMIFVKSDQMSKSASSLNQSVMIAQSVAEVWKAEGMDGLTKRFLAKDAGSGSYMMLFDESGLLVSEDQAVYDVTVVMADDADGMKTDIRVNRAGETIYQLHVARHEAGQ